MYNVAMDRKQLTKQLNNQYKLVWLKPTAEMSFLYGNNVIKFGLAFITEATPQDAGLVVYNMSDIPLGFGAAAQTTEAY